MERVSRVLVAAILLLSAGCASLPDTGGKASFPSTNTRIAELDLALEQETDAKKVPALLFERGHAYLDSAESLRASRRAAGEMNGGGVEFATLILYALRDLEAVVDEFPDSTEAPEALFHLGAVYDYPNISSFGPALRYYRRTVAEYPGTVPAIKAEQAIRIIEVNVKQIMEGEHGGGGGHPAASRAALPASHPSRTFSSMAPTEEGSRPTVARMTRPREPSSIR